jgi:hypothetical protein
MRNRNRLCVLADIVDNTNSSKLDRLQWSGKLAFAYRTQGLNQNGGDITC